MAQTTQQAMAIHYSNGQAWATKAAIFFREKGDHDKARAWQTTSRAWFQNRALELGLTDAMLTHHRLDDAAEAHNCGPIYAKD